MLPQKFPSHGRENHSHRKYASELDTLWMLMPPLFALNAIQVG